MNCTYRQRINLVCPLLFEPMHLLIPMQFTSIMSHSNNFCTPKLAPNHSKDLEKMIRLAEVTVATHQGRGRRVREQRSTFRPAVSKKTAKERKKKKKEREQRRAASKERTMERAKAESCKEGSRTCRLLEKQGLADMLLGGEKPIADAVQELASAVDGGQQKIDVLTGQMKSIAAFFDGVDKHQINLAAKDISKATDVFGNEFLPQLNKLTETLESLQDAVSSGSWLDGLSKLLPSKLTVDKFLAASLVCASLYCVMTGDFTPGIIISVLGFVRAIMDGRNRFMFGLNLAMNLLGKITQHHAAAQVILEKQGGLEKNLYALGTAGIICAIAGFTFKKSDTILELIHNALPDLGRFDAAKRGWRGFVDALLSAAQSVIDWIAKRLGKEPIKIKSDPFFFIEEYVAKVFRLRDEFSSGIRDQSTLYKANELYAEAQKVISEVRALGGTDYQLRDVAACKQVCSSIIEYLGQMNITTSGQRIAPVPILITGAPGVGKTVLMNWAWPVVAAKTLPVDELRQFKSNRGNYVYNFNQADKYYSGYRGQEHMIIDEFAFLRDTSGSESVFAEFIMMVNNNAYCLNMAALEDKARFYYRSKFLWLTTNRNSFQPDSMPSVQEPGAVVRRLDFAWMACISREYATESTRDERPENRVLDRTKLPKKIDKSFAHLKLHRFTNVKNGEISPDGISATEFIDEVVSEFHRVQSEGRDMLDMVDDSVDEIMRARLTKEGEVESQGASSTRKKRELETIVGDSVDDTIIDRMAQECGLECQGGTPVSAQERAGCDCAICHRIPYRITFENFHDSIRDVAKLDGDRVRITRASKNAVVTREEFDSMIARIPQRVRDGMTKVSSTYQSDCIREVAMRDGMDAMQLFIDYVVSCRLSVSFTDVFNKDYLAAKIPFALNIASFFSQIALGFGIVKFILYMFAGKTPKSYEGDEPTCVRQAYVEPEAVYNLRRVRVRAPPKRAQLGINGVEDVSMSVIKKNCFRVRCISQGGKKEYSAVITMIRSQVALVPFHVMEAWCDAFLHDEDAYLECRQTVQTNPVNGETKTPGQNIYLKNICDAEVDPDGVRAAIIAHKRVGGEDEDAVLVFLPTMRRGSDIIHHFLPRGYQIPVGTHSYFAGINPYTYGTDTKTGMCQYAANTRYEDCQAAHAIVSSYTTRKGDCGTLVGIVSPTAQRAFYGIHVAGNPHGQPTAYAIRTAREDLLEACRELAVDNNIAVDSVPESVPPNTKLVLEEQGGEGPFGVVPIAHVKASPIPMKTALIQSPLFGRLSHECTVEPANLRMYKGVGALEFASFKYNAYIKGIPLNTLRMAARIVAKNILGGKPPVYRRKLTIEEAVQGIEGDQYMNAIPRKTSAGIPWKELWSQPGKIEAMGVGPDITFDSDAMKAVMFEVRWCEKSILGGVRPLFVYSSFLKDELRPKGKAARMISSAPFHLGIMIRQHFMGFCHHMVTNRLTNGVAIGTNPMSEEWTILGDRHANMCVISGDFSRFDCTMEPNVMEEVRHIINQFYSDYGSDDYVVRNALFDEMVFSRHSFFGAVYEWIGCNPSGNYITAPLNSMVSQIEGYSVCVDIVEKDLILNDPLIWHRGVDVEAFIISEASGVIITVYGDDILISSADGKFSFRAFKQTFAKWGITFTDETKGDTDEDVMRTIDEVAFLKRGFLRTHPTDSKRRIAALSLETILNTIQWMKRTDAHHADFKDKVEGMLVELAAHGKPVYEKHQRGICDAWTSSIYGVTLEAMPWRERFELFLSSEAWM